MGIKMNLFKKIIVMPLAGILTVGLLGAFTPSTPNEYFNPKYYTDPIPEGYYSRVNTSLEGEAFRNNLYLTISDGHYTTRYHDNNEILRYTDPDPEIPGNIICLYTGNSYKERENEWNKEHVWAKSHGFPNESSAPHGDTHHLRPTLKDVNSMRSNFDFGEAKSVKKEMYGNKLASDSVFEPRDEVKGDVARMMFYMATRYGSQTSYKLKLVESRKGSGSSFGGLNDLIKWHYQDPVSKEEIYRNNIIYEKFQNNRNPYIDHPEWVDLAYPSEYANMDVDSTKVNKVINKINSLPETITLADKDLVNSTKALYDALNYAERKAVTNYSVLENALRVIYELENPGESLPDNPVNPGGNGVVVDFADSGVSNMSYTSNVNFTTNNLSFLASNLYVSGEDFRLGSNSNGSLDKLGLNEVGAYLEPQFDLEGLKSLKLHIVKAFNGYGGYKVFFKEAGLDSYTLVGEGTNGDINVTLDSPKNGRFVVAIIGSKARAQLGEYRLGIEKADLNTAAEGFIKEETKNSLRIKINNNAADIDLRFGIRLKATSYDEKAEYGVLVLPSSITINSDLQKDDSLLNTHSDKVIKATPARVDENGMASTKGDYYQFAWVITNMENHYAYSFNAVAYMKLDGKLYFAKPKASSVKATASFYLNNNLISDEIIKKVLEDLIK